MAAPNTNAANNTTGPTYEVSLSGKVSDQSRLNQIILRLESHADSKSDLDAKLYLYRKESKDDDTLVQVQYSANPSEQEQELMPSISALSKPLSDPHHLIRSCIDMPLLDGNPSELVPALGFVAHGEYEKKGTIFRLGTIQVLIYKITSSSNTEFMPITPSNVHQILIIDKLTISSDKAAPSSTSLSAKGAFDNSTQKLENIRELLRGLVDLQRGTL